MTMTNRERVILGGLGASAIGVASFPLKDYGLVDADPNTPFVIGGWVLRVLLFGSIGAVWAYMHSDENNRMRVFQLGMVAPAMLAALLSANGITGKPINTELTERSAGISLSSIFVSTAHAQQSPGSDQPTRPSPTSSIVRGLLGSGQ